MKPRLLDLFCGAGGAAMGYHRAGFDVTGVDHQPQPRYPFPFVQVDALDYLAKHGREYDVVHASPPCQRYSRLFQIMEHRRAEQLDLIAPTRNALQQNERPWIIENVQGSPLSRGSVMLCGHQFNLRTYRHRWFECSHLLLVPPHRPHRIKCPTRGNRRKEHFEAGGFISVVGNIGSYYGPAAMGIDWMTSRELSQAIPPAYTYYLGLQMRAMLSQ